MPLNPSPIEAAKAASVFNERFRILDSTTKQPVANVDYAIKRAGGKLEYGTTDANGYTHLLTSTTQMEMVEVFVEGEA